MSSSLRGEGDPEADQSLHRPAKGACRIEVLNGGVVELKFSTAVEALSQPEGARERAIRRRAQWLRRAWAVPYRWRSAAESRFLAGGRPRGRSPSRLRDSMRDQCSARRPVPFEHCRKIARRSSGCQRVTRRGSSSGVCTRLDRSRPSCRSSRRPSRAGRRSTTRSLCSGLTTSRVRLAPRHRHCL